MDEIAPQREQFGDFERRILTFEEEWARANPRTGHANTGPKLAAIIEAFPDLPSTTRYYQVLNRLLDMDEAEQFMPMMVRRLRNRRDEARNARQAASARAREIDAQTKGHAPAAPEEARVSTSRVERCEMLASLLKRAGLDRASVSLHGAEGVSSIVVVRSNAPESDGYYRLVPGIGEAVTIYYVPVEGPTRDLGHVLTHARAAGVVLDHLAGVHS